MARLCRERTDGLELRRGHAALGNVALFGELQANEGTLALGFGESLEGARTLARSSLSEGYGLIRQRFIDGWEAWGQKLIIPECPPDIEREAYISSLVLKVHEDRTFPGSIVASLSVPEVRRSRATTLL